jgi:flavin reductase (DIM6/NTAB) family NADH-FMN oxidoreductase RutF
MTAILTVAAPSYRETLGQFASGLTVISGDDHGEPVGFTCQAFASVSLDPPLVTFCVGVGSTSYPSIRRQGRFAASVLAHDQQWISDRFARSGHDKWQGVARHQTPGGLPVVCNALAWLECTVVAEHPAGDHWIVVGRVEHLDAERPGVGPLVYHGAPNWGLGGPAGR